MLQNAYLLAKIGADTAENEQHFAENLRKIDNYPTVSRPGLRLAVGPGTHAVLVIRLHGSLSQAGAWSDGKDSGEENHDRDLHGTAR